MVNGPGSHGDEARHIVFAWRIVAPPGDHIERRVIELGAPDLAAEFVQPLRWLLTVLVGCHWNAEIIGIRQTCGADQAEFRQAKRQAVIFADIAARLGIKQLDAELDTTRDQSQFSPVHILKRPSL